MEYTRKEREAIRAGWAQLSYLAESDRIDTERELKDALKYERKQRGSLTVAKALIIRDFVEGNVNPNTPAHVVYGRSPGLQWAFLYGAHCAEHYAGNMEKRRLLLDKAVTIMLEATIAHARYIERGADIAAAK